LIVKKDKTDSEEKEWNNEDMFIIMCAMVGWTPVWTKKKVPQLCVGKLK